jgi:hypothetical protein
MMGNSSVSWTLWLEIRAQIYAQLDPYERKTSHALALPGAVALSGLILFLDCTLLGPWR